MMRDNPDDRVDAATALSEWRRINGSVLTLRRMMRLKYKSEGFFICLLLDIAMLVDVGKIVLSRLFRDKVRSLPIGGKSS